MTAHAGYVHYVKVLPGDAAFASIGPTEQDSELLVVAVNLTQSAAVLAGKRTLVNLLVKACAYGFPVEAYTDGTTAIISAESSPLEVAPNDQPVHADFFAVTGSDFADDCELVFDSDTLSVVVTPDLVRPHLLLVTSFPTAVPVGWNALTVTSASGDRPPVLVDVSDEEPYLKRVFNSGAAKQYPFTLAIVANGAIDRDGTLNLYADPILADRPGYHAIVDYAMNNVFAVDEDYLRRDDRDAELRIVSIFDQSQAVLEGNTLCQEDPLSTVMTAVKERVNAFLAGYNEVTDLCIAFHGSATNTRGSASRCVDDYTRGTPEPFTIESVAYSHWPFRDDPGSTAISVDNLTSKMTAIHELGHAASESANGRVRDLYTDDTYPELTVNKRWRAASTDPIPLDFAEYNGRTYKSDQTRDGRGYPTTWITYHCRLKVDTSPNVMDSYNSASRLDRLTYDWYADRLRVILDR